MQLIDIFCVRILMDSKSKTLKNLLCYSFTFFLFISYGYDRGWLIYVPMCYKYKNLHTSRFAQTYNIHSATSNILMNKQPAQTKMLCVNERGTRNGESEFIVLHLSENCEIELKKMCVRRHIQI